MDLMTVYSKNRKELDEMLKRAAFEMKGIDENLSAEVRQIHYRIVGKAAGGEPSKKEYVDAEQRYKARVAQAFDSFSAEVTGGTIDAVAGNVNRLKNATLLKSVLSEYFEMDKQLVEVEVLARHAERRIEEAIQLRIDLERGK